MKAAYADPPYMDQARKHYHCPEINHEILINSLEMHYDGWALSCSSSSLQRILELCPPDVRIAAWVKPFASFKPNVNPAYAWEPIIFRPLPRARDRSKDTTRDWFSGNITLQKGLTGAKSEAFCMWIFDLLGLELEDSFDDLFLGTGAVMTAYRKWRSQTCLEDV